MKKLNFKVKKTILISVLVVLVITFGTVIVSSIMKEHNTKDTQTLVKDNKLINIKENDSQQVKAPAISNDENKQINSNSETPKKADKVVKPDPPKEKPKTNDDITNKNKVPTYTENEVKPQSQTPAGGETGTFPGFGQVEDGGENKGENVNSSGNINNQVGEMN